jgi:transcriptional/translational regulatory protein YebC/TACO1
VAQEANLEKQILRLIDLGVEDVAEEGENLVVLTSPDRLAGLKDLASEVELIWQPINKVLLEDPEALNKVTQLLTILENHDDVQKIYTNW